MRFSFLVITGFRVARMYINGAVLHYFRLLKQKANYLFFPTDPAYPEGRIQINKKKINTVRKFSNHIPDDDRIQEFYKRAS